MGGKVGLKGSDGEDILCQARKLGASETSPRRTIEALTKLTTLKDSFELITYPREMGEDEAHAAGLNPQVIGNITVGDTTSADTKQAARDMLELSLDLLLFSGGDGTARDISEVIDSKIPVLGIPTGVKIHSGVFAVSPTAAGVLASRFLRGEISRVHDSEVMDIDEEAYRGGVLSARLYGYMIVPHEDTLVQGSKEAVVNQEDENLRAIAADIEEEMKPDTLYVLGPGGTITKLSKYLGFEKTLLGVDILENGKIIARDVNEKALFQYVKNRKTMIIVTIIGGQGFVFGRGNQQISPYIIRTVGKENIIIVATPEKLATLHGRPLLVDTGDRELDEELSGYVRIVTDYHRRVVYKIMIT